MHTKKRRLLKKKKKLVLFSALKFTFLLQIAYLVLI